MQNNLLPFFWLRIPCCCLLIKQRVRTWVGASWRTRVLFFFCLSSSPQFLSPTVAPKSFITSPIIHSRLVCQRFCYFLLDEIIVRLDVPRHAMLMHSRFIFSSRMTRFNRKEEGGGGLLLNTVQILYAPHVSTRSCFSAVSIFAPSHFSMPSRCSAKCTERDRKLPAWNAASESRRRRVRSF